MKIPFPADHTVKFRNWIIRPIDSGIEQIRKILGPTDPSKAEPGSVRKEYGQSIMVNAAHASDSPDNAKREMGIVKPEKDTIKAFVDQYYPA